MVNTTGINHNCQRSVDKWVAELVGHFKVTVDASVISGNQNYAIGVLLRDHQGGFNNARNIRRDMGELFLKLRLGVSWKQYGGSLS